MLEWLSFFCSSHALELSNKNLVIKIDDIDTRLSELNEPCGEVNYDLKHPSISRMGFLSFKVYFSSFYEFVSMVIWEPMNCC